MHRTAHIHARARSLTRSLKPTHSLSFTIYLQTCQPPNYTAPLPPATPPFLSQMMSRRPHKTFLFDYNTVIGSTRVVKSLWQHGLKFSKPGLYHSVFRLQHELYKNVRPLLLPGTNFNLKLPVTERALSR